MNQENTSLDLSNVERQTLLSTLAKSELEDIQHFWDSSLNDIDYEFIRSPEIGMVMAVARTGVTGEPFNLGEVSVTRCAVKLASGENGFGYVIGRNNKHSIHIAVIDALAQDDALQADIVSGLIKPLQRVLAEKDKIKQDNASKTKVDFFTMVRGEDD